MTEFIVKGNKFVFLSPESFELTNKFKFVDDLYRKSEFSNSKSETQISIKMSYTVSSLILTY